MGDMQPPLTFAQVASILEFVHAIHAQHSDAFRARLKHLQRLGFPSGINTGKGKAAEYNWREIIMLAVALQLIELGLAPEKAKLICADNEFGILRAFAKTILAPDADDYYFLLIYSSSFDHLRSEEEEKSTSINILPLKEVRSLFTRDPFFSRIVMINLNTLFAWLRVGPVTAGIEKSGHQMLRSLEKWAGQFNDQHPQA
ncbi:hypothetical protein [Sphingobium xenophagum]|uniref:HTH merR-type domain-containing protein n=1 Tax=Sphingobium xenophagum TaxID=121428 RepID=A0A401IZ90_SPHXE|nr:hypothetical protein [Sphingobium xenophagum]GBH29689.1 hypothetical protein MBESOW_P0943 [Sphingobium xenophagum]